VIVCVYVRTYVCMRMYVCMYVCMRMQVRVYVCVCMYVCMRIYVRVYVCVRTCLGRFDGIFVCENELHFKYTASIRSAFLFTHTRVQNTAETEYSM